MTKQFNFSSESAAKVLNHINRSIDEYAGLQSILVSETLRYTNSGRVKALTEMYTFLQDVFTACGLEIMELDTEEVPEEVEEEVEHQPMSPLGSIMFNAFSHFSK